MVRMVLQGGILRLGESETCPKSCRWQCKVCISILHREDRKISSYPTSAWKAPALGSPAQIPTSKGLLSLAELVSAIVSSLSGLWAGCLFHK